MSIVKNMLHYDSGAIRSDDYGKLQLTDLYEELREYPDILRLGQDIEHNENKFIGYYSNRGVTYETTEVISMMGRIDKLLSVNTSVYGNADNWKKGISIVRSINSIFRHLVLYFLADTREDHLAAIIFNVLAVDATERKIKSGALEITYDGRCDGEHLEVYYGLNDNK